MPQGHDEREKHGNITTPNLKDPNEAKLEVKHLGKPQTLIIEIYKTESFQRKIFPNKFRQGSLNRSEDSSALFSAETDGKKNLDTIRVRPGAEFTIPQFNSQHFGGVRRENESHDNRNKRPEMRGGGNFNNRGNDRGNDRKRDLKLKDKQGG